VVFYRGQWRRAGAAGMLLSYLSLVHAGGTFFMFQWDNLVLETLWLCLLLPNSSDHEPHPLVALAFRWLLLRLYLESGWIKVLHGDESWGRWLAMDRYYETAPIPLLAGWLFHQLPHAVHVVEQVLTLVVECVLPFTFLLAPKVRRWAALPAILLQVMIALTASYGSFNFVTALLCLWLLDESVLARLRRTPHVEPAVRGPSPLVPVVAGVLMAWGAVAGLTLFIPRLAQPPVQQVEQVLGPWHLAHSYHLFANVTLSRPAVFVQTSDDGEHWTTHFMHHAPGRPDQRPPLWLAPHHPRVDFQMWFFGLNPRVDRWHLRLLQSLCKEQSPAHALFEKLPAKPPRMVQFIVAEDHMADLATWRASGAWWLRSGGTPFSPIQCPAP